MSQQIASSHPATNARPLIMAITGNGYIRFKICHTIMHRRRLFNMNRKFFKKSHSRASFSTHKTLSSCSQRQVKQLNQVNADGTTGVILGIIDNYHFSIICYAG
jgi:hypothetical protein